MDSRKTGELIKEIRIEKNMKQKDLADRLFVSVAAVSKWENGHGFPDVSVLPDLCRILDLSIEEFMKGERNSMENKQNTVIDDVVEIAGHQQKQRKKVIRILSILLLLLILVSIMQGALSYMRGKKTYVPLKAGSDLMSTNMYIENNGDTPTLFYKGKKFKQLYDDFIIDSDKNEYLIISIETNLWNENFGTSGTGQYAFQSFNELAGNHINIYDWYKPEHFKGVYLYEGDLRELLDHFSGTGGFTRVNVKTLLSYCTYIPYSKEIIKTLIQSN